MTTVLGLSGVTGAAEGSGVDARFASPWGLALDPAGNLYVADSANYTLRKATFVASPSVTIQPVAASANQGQTATFTVAATGGGTLSFQWQRQASPGGGFVNVTNGGAYAGAATASLTVSGLAVTMNGDQFRCVVANAAGTVTTAVVTLTVNSAPVITSAASATFYTGQAGSFQAVATGAPAPTWAVSAGTLPSWATFNSATGAIIGTPSSTVGSPFSFTLAATNSLGTVSQSFVLSVQVPAVAPTVFLLSARRQVVVKGQSLTLTVSAVGTGPLAYQWRRSGRPIPGATGTSYTIANATAADGGYYQAVVTNAAGSTNGQAVFVNVAYAATEVLSPSTAVAVPSGLGSVVGIATGYYFGAALKADGTVQTWASDSYYRPTVPTGLSEVVAIAAGYYQILALKSDGTVVAFASSYNGSPAPVPAGLTDVVAIAAGSSHGLALKGDGTVVEWGTGAGSNSSYVPAPAGLNSVSAIAAGGSASLAVRRDGSIASWGYSSGYLGSPPSSVLPAATIATNGSVAVVVKADGTVSAWGSTSYQVTNVPAGLSNVTAVGLTYSQALALRSDGGIVAWGDSTSTAFPANLRSIVAIAVGADSSRLALRDASNDTLPTFTAGPVSVAANLGQGVTFKTTVTAGTALLTYQWLKDGVAIAGAVSPTYTINGVSAASVGSYSLTATTSLGSVTSSAASLTLNAAPVVSATTGGRYPLSSGQNLTLNLASSISGTATVQWRQNGRTIPGATGRSYAIVNATANQGGYYQAVYDEGSGPVYSGAIFVPYIPGPTQVLQYDSAGTESAAPSIFNTIVALSARSNNLIGLKADGTVVRAVSSTVYDVGAAPVGLTGVVAVSAGYSFFLALRADGTVLSWSDSGYYYSSSTPPAVPDGLNNVVAISAGNSHALALKGDGTVVAWGAANYGATAVPAGLANVIAIAAGDGFSLALKADGTVIGWGRNANGESVPPLGLTNVVAIATGSSFSVALKADGSVVAWGYGSYGQTTIPSGLSGVVAIAAGDTHGLALKGDGTVTPWGRTVYYQDQAILLPVSLRNVVAVAGGTGTSFVLRDAAGDTLPVVSSSPVAVTALLGQNVVLRVAATAGTAPLAYQWRRSGSAISGATAASLTLASVTAAQADSYDVMVSNYLGNTVSQSAVVTVTSTPAVGVSPPGRQMISAGQPLTLTGTTALTGPVTYQWRRNGQVIPGATTAIYAVGATTWANGGVYQFVASNSVGPALSAPVFVAVSGAYQVRAWGDNSSGQSSVPSGLTGVVSLAAGTSHSLALKADGTLVSWGINSAGQLGIPAGLSNVVGIAAGNYFSLALRADGTVVTWGSLNYTPPGLTGVVAVSADTYGTVALALRADGTVIAWDTDGVRTDVPVGLGDVVAIDAGVNFHLALKSDGSVVRWGSASSYGTPPTGLAAVTAISTGYDFGLALKADGTVVGWGGSSSSSSGAAVPAGLTGVVAVSAGYGIAYALKADGSVVTWGSGNSSTLATGAPAAAPALLLAPGYSHVLALRDPAGDVVPAITAQTSAQTVISGQALTLSVTVTGVPAPTYQWYRNGIVLSSATSATYRVAAAGSGDAGTYTVIVSNALGSVTSADMVVTVPASLAGRGLLAGTAHANAGPVTIASSFTVEGTASKTMLIRGVGPALATFGVTDVLADPQISIASASGVILATNDNWSDATNTSSISSAATQAGAFALPFGGRDAAVLRSFSPGTYHVRLTGTAGASGIALLEIYDADTVSRTVYLATTAFAGTGADAFVQGMLLATPPVGRSYLIRALGPTLGSSDALADPRLAIFSADGTQLAANDDWAGDPALAALATSVGAMPLGAASKDAALAFAPTAGGTYTVRATGTPGATGRVLVEIFEVDAQRAATTPVAIVSAPQPQIVLSGQRATFGVVTVGRPAPTYQWRKNGTPLDGATDATFAVASAQTGDAGDYTVVVTNANGTVTSAAATLTLATQTATHAVVGHGYVSGDTVTITNTLTYTGTATGLGWAVTLPAGWSYAGGTGEGDVKPALNATGTLSWSWTTPPASPLVFSYVLNVPAGETAVRTLAATAIVRTGTAPQTSAAAPGALAVAAAPAIHSADTNQDNRISLTELTRVIELFNTVNGTVRTGAYQVATTTTEDGFAADAARAASATAVLSVYHSADSDRDGRIGLFELTRVIELYNTRAGTSRTGRYHAKGSTEDGFAPGP